MAGEQYLRLIQSGEKTHEGRVNGPLCQKIGVGDHIKFFDRKAHWGIICEVTEKKEFSTFDKMLDEIKERNLLPHMKKQFENMTSKAMREAALKVYQSFPGAYRVSRNGCVAIGVKFLERV